MLTKTRYLYVASMDVDADKEALFNEVYDREHVPALRTVAGVGSIARFARQEEFLRMVKGEKYATRADGEPRYHALYELESPDVLVTDAWAKAVESGRWPEQVRPYTRNRRHILLKLVYPE